MFSASETSSISTPSSAALTMHGSNHDGVLDAGDLWVSVNGSNTVIDIGLAAQSSAAGLNTVALESVTGLMQSDFIFA